MNIEIDDINVMLLESIMADSGIKAALVVDPDGNVVERLGSAMSLRDTRDDDAATLTGSLENVYIKAYGENFVIVLFDEKKIFERIRGSVDEQVDRALTAL